MKTLRILIFFTCCLIVLSSCVKNPEAQVQENLGQNQVEQKNEKINIKQLIQLTFLAHPEKYAPAPYARKAIEDTDKIILNGKYISPYQGYQVIIPKVANNNNIIVHQSLVYKKTDGTPSTSCVIFTPQNGGYGASAIVVTKISNDKPWSTETILSQFEPKTLVERAYYKEKGITYQRVKSHFGLCIQRSVKNQLFRLDFPFSAAIEPTKKDKTLGISRYVLIGQYLFQFSAIVRSKQKYPSKSLQEEGELVLDSLMKAMIVPPH